MTIFGVSGVWAYLILAAFFVRGMIKVVRKSNELFTVKYSLDGQVMDRDTESIRYSVLRRRMRQTKMPFGMGEMLGIVREAGMKIVEQPEEFSVGDYHRYTLNVRRSYRDHVIVIEIFPSSRRAAPVAFELPSTQSLTAP